MFFVIRSEIAPPAALLRFSLLHLNTTILHLNIQHVPEELTSPSPPHTDFYHFHSESS